MHPVDQFRLGRGQSAPTCPSMPAVKRPALRSVTRRTLSSVFARERSINFCRLRTCLRSPACDAVKILLPQPPYVILDRTPVDRMPVEDLVLGSVHHHTRRPEGRRRGGVQLVRRFQRRRHVLSTGSPDSRQHPFGSGISPYPAGYPPTRRWRPTPTCLRFPVAFRHAGIRFWVILCPLRSWAFLAVGLPATPTACRTPTGLPRSTRARHDRDGCPLYPEDGGAHPTGNDVSGRHPPLPSGQSLDPTCNIPPARVPPDEASSRVHRFTRPVFPFACGHRMERQPLGLIT